MFLPKPELFDHRELSLYLYQAKRAVRRGSFAKKTLEGGQGRRKVVESYWKLCGEGGVPTEGDIDEQTQRIDRAQPEILIFKFFKAAVSKQIVCREGLPLSEELQAKLDAELAHAEATGKDSEAARARYDRAITKAQDEQWQGLEEALRTSYDAVFGDGTYAALLNTSTLMPAKDLASTVDRFWSLPGSQFGLAVPRVEDAPDDVREKILIQVLNSLAQGLYEKLEAEARPMRASPEKMAHYFMADLYHPADDQGIVALSGDQLLAYQHGKADAKRQVQEARLCPICNDTFRGGTTGKADFLPKPESHTNRAIAHGRPGNIVICDKCKYERFLQQLLLGEKGSNVLVLLPHMNVGQFAGQEMIRRAHRIREEAEDLMSTRSKKPDEHLSLQLTNVIYNKIQGLDPYRLTTDELLRAITYTSSEKAQKEHHQALANGLRELADMPADGTDIAPLNEATGEEFVSWDDALNQIISGAASNEIIDPVKATAFRLRPILSVICQTPNMMLMPVADSFAVGKDGETNAALRQLFIMLLLGLALDCSVDVVRPGDPILFDGGEGIARVPPVPALRGLIGTEWITLDQTQIWMRAIGAAALLANATAYPERSNIYQILAASTPGHVLRRVEQKGDGAISLWHVQLIEQVKEVLHA